MYTCCVRYMCVLCVCNVRVLFSSLSNTPISPPRPPLAPVPNLSTFQTFLINYVITYLIFNQGLPRATLPLTKKANGARNLLGSEMRKEVNHETWRAFITLAQLDTDLGEKHFY